MQWKVLNWLLFWYETGVLKVCAIFLITAAPDEAIFQSGINVIHQELHTLTELCWNHQMIAPYSHNLSLPQQATESSVHRMKSIVLSQK